MKIESLKDLMDAFRNKKAVICPNSRAFAKPRPAAFMIHQSGFVLNQLFQSGMFLYEGKKKK